MYRCEASRRWWAACCSECRTWGTTALHAASWASLHAPIWCDSARHAPLVLMHPVAGYDFTEPAAVGCEAGSFLMGLLI